MYNVSRNGKPNVPTSQVSAWRSRMEGLRDWAQTENNMTELHNDLTSQLAMLTDVYATKNPDAYNTKTLMDMMAKFFYVWRNAENCKSMYTRRNKKQRPDDDGEPELGPEVTRKPETLMISSESEDED